MAKKSFLERLTGGMRFQDEEEVESPASFGAPKKITLSDKDNAKETDAKKDSKWEEEEEAQLTVDLYQTATEIIVQTMVAGVQPENLSITITRDMITMKGKREENRSISIDNYFVQELYWGAFSRTISLPEEVDPEEAEAIEKHGLLIIKLPKINKEKKTILKVKSV
jgi:HSP20 family protein